MSTALNLVLALIRRLHGEGALDDSDLAAIADEVDSAREEDAEAAHQVRCIGIEAAAPSQSDWKAERARSRFRVIEGDE